MLGWASWVEPFWIEVEQYPLPLKNLPPDWIGKRLVHISDLHVGCVSADYLQSAMQQVNSLKPDMIAITGDFVDRGLGRQNQLLAKVLDVLEPPRIATVACLGNHDYGHHWLEVEVAEQVAEVVRGANIQLLRDEQIEIEGLTFIGIDDLWSPRFMLDRPLPNPLRIATPFACAITLTRAIAGYGMSSKVLFSQATPTAANASLLSCHLPCCGHQPTVHPRLLRTR